MGLELNCWNIALQEQDWQVSLVRPTAGVLKLALEVSFLEDFSYNPNQTHRNKLIEVFGITSYRQAGLIKVGAKLLQERGPQGPRLRTPVKWIFSALEWVVD